MYHRADIRLFFARLPAALRVLRGELPPTRPRGRVGAARVAIVTITEGEFLAAQTVLGLRANVAGSAYFVGQVTSSNNYQVVLRRAAAQGNIEAAQAVGSAVEDFRPDYIFLVGTAGGSGKDDGQVGDVVVADVVAYYEHRKYVGGRISPDAHRAISRLCFYASAS